MIFIIIEYLVVFMLLLFTIKYSLGSRKVPVNHDVLISMDTSQMLKSVCCIIIVLHHFAMDRQDITALKIISMGGGNFALPIFFILSAYGVIKSDLYKPVNNFTNFFKKRVFKLLKPLWIINFFTIIVYYLIGINGYQFEILKQASVNPIFCKIVSHSLSIYEYIYLLVGIHQIDVVIWFVEVTLYSYLIFYISKSIFPIKERKNAFVFLYTFFILLFGLIALEMEMPAHYYRNLWSLIVGLVLAVYENDFIHRKKYFICFLGLIMIYLITQCALLHEYIYIFPAIFAVVFIFVCDRFMKNRFIIPGSAISKLAAMSYVIYLIHVKILNIEWYYLGYVSVLLPLIIVLLLAYIYEFVDFKKV